MTGDPEHDSEPPWSASRIRAVDVVGRRPVAGTWWIVDELAAILERLEPSR